jgi:MoxR-like ATPase
MTTEAQPSDLQVIQRLNSAYRDLRQEVARVIVGQEEVLEQLVMCILARGHAILEGPPGVGKSLLISTIARCMKLKFARIQFTPDLMPTDITGTEVLQEDKTTGERTFRFLEGPIFANVVLAGEVNRTPPKTQAALLEAMQERQVTAGGRRHPMLDPFFVLATQVSMEQEGVYPLPEAQQDRFMFKIVVRYPNPKEELEVIGRTTSEAGYEPQAVLERETLLQLQRLVRRIPAADHVMAYAMKLVRATRVTEPDVPEIVREYVRWGAGPRACQYLVLGGRARAALHGRCHVSCDDVAAMAKPVLRHRILTNFVADADGVTTDKLVEHLLEKIPPRRPSAQVEEHYARLVMA